MNSNTRVSFIVLYFFALLFIFVRIYMSRVYICKICHSESKQTFTMNHPQVNISDGWLTVCFHYGFIHWIRQQKSHSLITSQLLALISWSFCFAYSLCALTPSHKCHIFDRQLPFNNTHTHRWIMQFASFSIGSGVVSFVSRHKLQQYKYENCIFAFAIQIFYCWFNFCWFCGVHALNSKRIWAWSLFHWLLRRWWIGA